MSKAKTSTAQTRCLAEVEIVPIDWLWPKRLARGKLSLLAGQPGLGKSQIAILMAAKVSRGGFWLDGTVCPIGNVLLISCEDDAADTIAPRLDAAGADRSRIHVLDWIEERGDDGSERCRTFDIAKDADVMRDLCRQIGDVALIVVDPVSAYLGAADSHKTSDVRAALAPLQTIAAEISACIVLISHLNKGAVDASAMSRVAGSGAFVAAARSAWIVGPHPQDEGLRVLVPLKNNIGDDKTGFAYRITGATVASGIETSLVTFDETLIYLKPEDVLGAGSGSMSSDRGAAKNEAKEFLTAALANGPLHSADLKREAEAAGIAWRTIERAKGDLGVRSQKGARQGGGWVWSLPEGHDKGRQDRQDRHSPSGRQGGGLGVQGEDRQEIPSENVGGLGGVGGLEEVPPRLNGSSRKLL